MRIPCRCTPYRLQATLGLLPVSANAAHLAEGLSAARAAVGLLLRVDCAVPLQVAGRDEALAAQSASITSLPSVDEEVDTQVVGLGKTFSAVWTRVGSFPCVHPLVQLQGGYAGEDTPADSTNHGIFCHSGAAPI